MIARPTALLLDFGGVIVDAPAHPPAPPELVSQLVDLTGGTVDPGRVAADVAAGSRAYAAWRDAMSREAYPAEVRHTQLWDEFVTGGWPEPARQAVRDQATPLAYRWTRRPDWAVLPGMADLLAMAADAGIPVGIVSNTLCGAAHRDFLAEVGLAHRFAVQCYSDEVGVRKPNPELALRAAAALDVPIGECWFVGDSPSRDVACARRAGVGTVILMRSDRTDREQVSAEYTPDVVADDGRSVVALLARSLTHGAGV